MFFELRQYRTQPENAKNGLHSWKVKSSHFKYQKAWSSSAALSAKKKTTSTCGFADLKARNKENNSTKPSMKTRIGPTP